MMELRGWRKICGLAFVGVTFASCSPHETVRRDSEVVFVEMGGAPQNRPQSNRHPDRVATGMSRQEVEALMGSSRETCWMYREGVVERRICFRDGKVSAVSKLEYQPGKNQASIDAVFTTEESPSASDSSQVDGLAIGMALPQVARVVGPPRAIVEEYDDVGSIYRATFVDGRLNEFRHIPPPPVY